MTWYAIENRTHPLTHPLRVRRCAKSLCRFRGLMFRRDLDPQEGLMFVWHRPGRWSTAIHMWGMFFPITILWLNDEGRIVDKRLGRPWRTIAVPREPARFVLELHASRFHEFHIGDVLHWRLLSPPP